MKNDMERRKSIDMVENFRFYRPYVSTKKTRTQRQQQTGNDVTNTKATVGSSDLENDSSFSSGHVALATSLLYVDESDVRGDGNRVHPFEQRSILFETEKKRGPEHGKRMYLPIRSTQEVPNCWNGAKEKKHGMGEIVPWKHGPSYASKWAFPEGASLDLVRMHSLRERSLRHVSDPLDWQDRGHGGVSCHSYLVQHTDEHMTTTYGHVFRWWRPCTSLKIESPDLKNRGGYLCTQPPVDINIATWRKWSWHSICSHSHRLYGFAFRNDEKSRTSYDLTGATILLSQNGDKQGKNRRRTQSTVEKRNQVLKGSRIRFGLKYWRDSSMTHSVTYFAVPKSNHRRDWIEMLQNEIDVAESSIVIEGM